ncbi:MAG: hypothetical protein ACOCQD_05335 [archaeon]
MRLKSLKESKQGQSAAMYLIGISVLVIAALFALMLFGVIQTGYPSEGEGEEGTSGGCNTDPSIDVTAVNNYKTGTSVEEDDLYARKNGRYIGDINDGINAAEGDEVDILWSKDGYLDQVVAEGHQMECGTNGFSLDVKPTSDSSVKVYSEDNDVLTDDENGGDVNEASSSTSITNSMKVTAPSEESSGELIAVVEAANDTAIDNIKLSGTDDADVPEFYDEQSTNTVTEAFSIDELEDGASFNGDITLSPESGETITDTSVHVTFYSAQDAVDDENGEFLKGVVEDSGDNEKYENSFDYDYYVE